MNAKAVVLTIDIANEQDMMTIIIQPSKRESEKISVWLKDYKFGDVSLDEVIKVVLQQVSTALKNAGYEVKKRMPKIGDGVTFTKSVADVLAGDKGTIVAIESDRPYPYMVRVKNTEIFAKLDDFDLL
ncbi:MAG: hypothetical protein ACE5J2_02040 [Nitrososphaerales archaeon]